MYKIIKHFTLIGDANASQIVSLLQSSPNSVYIQILCMDPMITISEIKKDFAKEISSHVCGNAFLNKIIQVSL